ncbi:uncharacterized protein [Venturia canescens]|uniref:uncharacterized protein n=1 Tax=Venturia canescens TaxID=32260 RepID=UPI001C9CFF06|nr:uncharacterized protein LOC122418501 [Venturia canescens]XP_043288683.1 uncharacterized protein LOC122418501 [Venturia canescens]XP_043288684.1 uncharacterized protein LOC122418501 [Venturia canescens]
MALSLALALAGFDENDFRGLMALCRRGFQNEGGRAMRTVSPSDQSESSGISSLIISTISSTYSITPSLSSTSSRSETPENHSPKLSSKDETLMLELHKKRDILNLAENLHDSSWNLKSPSIPRNDTKSYMTNRSIHYRLSASALEEDYPVRICGHCGFSEPSPYLF